MDSSALRPIAAALGLLITGVPVSAHADQVKTVFVISMENTNWTQPPGGWTPQIYRNPAAPFLNGLVSGTLPVRVDGRTITSQTAYAVAYHNVLSTPSGDNPHIHPSEPNYIWSEAGSNLGVRSDDEPYGPSGTNRDTSDHLSAYLLAAGRTFRSYQEDIDLVRNTRGEPTNTVLPRSQWKVPLRDFSGTSDAYRNRYNGTHQYNYAAKHNPMVFFSDTNGGDDPTPANPAVRHYAPLEQLQQDLDAGAVADYNWITPDQYNDMHTSLDGGFVYHGVHYTGADAKIAQGDNFLSRIVPTIMASKAYREGGAIILWWDESVGAQRDSYATTIPEIVISPLAHPNVRGVPYASRENLTHSDDLRTMQDIFGVGPAGGFSYLGDAANARGLGDLFAPGAVAPAAAPRRMR
ncbi:MAG: phosphoesterase [Betaproteobacteria bacterium]|nr:phosphoesterase [Betaproteobacteria bacterium]